MPSISCHCRRTSLAIKTNVAVIATLNAQIGFLKSACKTTSDRDRSMDF
jgi:hypothetical protein